MIMYRYFILLLFTLVGVGCTMSNSATVVSPTMTALSTPDKEGTLTIVKSTATSIVLSTLTPLPPLPTLTSTPTLTPIPTLPTLPITSTFRAVPYTETEWSKVIELSNIHGGRPSPDNSLIVLSFIEETHVIDAVTGEIEWIFDKDPAAVSGTQGALPFSR